MPTTTFRMTPCWPSVFMIMLATQPMRPPTTSQMMKFMLFPCFKPLKTTRPLRSGMCGPALTLRNDRAKCRRWKRV